MVWNDQVAGLQCLRCHAVYESGVWIKGCVQCLESGSPASLKILYKQPDFLIASAQRGLFRYVSRLPFQEFPSLGEGSTPLIHFEDWAREWNISLFALKNEGQNPTGSHKDRMSPLFVQHAKVLGKPGVVIASSGNAGLSLAAYAANANMPCVVVTSETISEPLRRALTLLGATLSFGKETHTRWKLAEEWVEEHGYYPASNIITPPVGSNPYGIQGYKTIAFELYEQLEQACPTVLVVPTSRGDVLWGIWEGFYELFSAGKIEHLPRMVAVEPFPRLLAVTQGSDYRQTFEGQTTLASIAGATATFQAVEVLKASNGCAVVVTSKEANAAQEAFAKKGLLLETSSATVLPATIQLVKQGFISQADRVIAIGTSHLFKGL